MDAKKAAIPAVLVAASIVGGLTVATLRRAPVDRPDGGAAVAPTSSQRDPKKHRASCKVAPDSDFCRAAAVAK